METEAAFWQWVQEADIEELTRGLGFAGPIIAPVLRIVLGAVQIRGRSGRDSGPRTRVRETEIMGPGGWLKGQRRETTRYD